MKEIVLKNGFKTEISDDVLDNMELVEALEGEEDALMLSNLCKLLLGEEKKKELYDYLRTEDGRVPIEGVGEAVEEIIKVFGEKGKN